MSNNKVTDYVGVLHKFRWNEKKNTKTENSAAAATAKQQRGENEIIYLWTEYGIK